MTSRSIVFRCDAGPTIGGGHAMRCLTLADALAQAGWRVLFALGGDSIATVPALAKHTHLFVGGSPESEARQIAAALGGDADWLVVDHYQRDSAFERSCRAWAKRIMVIDDLADRRHDCDLLLDQTIGRTAEDYVALVPSQCRLLLGSSFALIRPQFAAYRPRALQRRRTPGPAKRLLLSFGASDPRGFTARLLASLAARSAPLAMDVISGMRPDNALSALAAAHPRQVTLHAAVEDMASLMLAADLATGAGGSTSWERCALGLPAVIAVTDLNQRLIAERLAAAGAAIVLGADGDFDAESAAMTILALARDPDRLARMSAAAFAVCDGDGAARVAAHVVAADLVNV